MAEKRRATTFRTSKGTIVNVAAPTVYVSPAFLSTEDVTNPTEMREALREELHREQIIKTFPHPELSVNEVNAIIPHVDGKVYVSVGPAGEFWSWDGKVWTLEYIYPHTAKTLGEYNWRLTAWVAEVFGGNLYFGGKHWALTDRPCIVRFDGTSWTVIDLGAIVGEVYGLIAHYVGGQWWLYASIGDSVDGNGKVYRTADGVTWSLVYTAVGVQLFVMAVHNNRLYVGNSSNNLYYTIDGTTFLTIAVGGTSYTMTAFDGLLYFVRSNRDICTYDGAVVTHLCSFLNFSGWIGLKTISNRTLLAILMNASETGGISNLKGYSEVWATHGYQAFPSGFRKVLSSPVDIGTLGRNPELIYGRVWVGTGLWRSYQRQSERYIPQASIREDYTPTLYAFNPMDFIDPKSVTPSMFSLWEDETIGATDETDPIPVYGFENIEVFFLSDTAGTLTIEADTRGDGTFDMIITQVIGVATPEIIPLTWHPIYLKLSFSAIANVTARVSCR